MTTPELRSIQERLDAVRAAASANAHRTVEQSRALLESRARRLARPARAPYTDAGATIELLLVQVEEEQLVIPLSSIVAIARAGSIAPLPRAVRPVYGVTAWRGRPLTVLTLGAGRPAHTDETRLVVLGAGARAALGIVVDAVHDVARTTSAELTPPGLGPRHAYSLGITPEGLLVVSGEKLLHPDARST